MRLGEDVDDPHKAGHDETRKGGRYPATRARATARTILLLALAICGTAFAVGHFGMSYHGLATLMSFAATAVMFLAALACIIIQFLIPLLKDIVGRKR